MPDAPVPPPLLARNQVIGGLRQLADYLDQHPGVPVDEHGWDMLVFARDDTGETGRAEVKRVAAILGVPADDDLLSGGLHTAAKAFGRITYRFIRLPARRPATAAQARNAFSAGAPGHAGRARF